MGELAFTTPVTFFVGENGSGKSTLLEAIAVAFGFNAEGGTRNFRFSTYRDVSGLAGALHLARGLERPRTGYFFRAESFFNVATQAEGYWGPDGPSPYGELHKQSHGCLLYTSCAIEFDGQTLNLFGIQKYFENPDRDLRAAAFEAYANFYESHEQRFEEVWGELIELRNQMGVNLGFENFIPLGYLRQGRSD